MPRYLIFIKRKKGEDLHNEWAVTNKRGQLIGDIAWHKKWHKYAFYPDIMSMEHEIYLCEMCLREIADYLHKINFDEEVNETTKPHS